MWSVKSGNVEMCKLLIDNGALPFINTPNSVIAAFLYIILNVHINVCL